MIPSEWLAEDGTFNRRLCELDQAMINAGHVGLNWFRQSAADVTDRDIEMCFKAVMEVLSSRQGGGNVP